MPQSWTPMRWPSQWKDPATLDLLKGCAIDYLLIGDEPVLAGVRKRALADGLAASAAAPPGVELVTGTWPGVKMGRRGAAGAGPTAAPWVDSNGWAVRLSLALHPEAAVWVDAAPAAGAWITADSYRLAIADTAAYGGRWVVSLDNSLAVSLASGDSTALATWRKLSAATGFFAERKQWLTYAPLAVIGVISSFTGDDQFFGQEMLNLLGRVGCHYRVLPKGAVADGSFESLRALLYTDAEPPSDALRKRVLDFVAAGGLLIAGPNWGSAPGAPAGAGSVPNFSMRSLGKGQNRGCGRRPGRSLRMGRRFGASGEPSLRFGAILEQWGDRLVLRRVAGREAKRSAPAVLHRPRDGFGGGAHCRTLPGGSCVHNGPAGSAAGGYPAGGGCDRGALAAGGAVRGLGTGERLR